MRQRLKALACKWLDTDDEDWLSQTVTLKEVSAVASKAERSAKGLPFEALATVHRTSPRGFRRLLSFAPSVPTIETLETSTETLRTSKEEEIAKLTQELHETREELSKLRNTRVKRYGSCRGWLGMYQQSCFV